MRPANGRYILAILTSLILLVISVKIVAAAPQSPGLVSISPPLKQLTIAPGLLQATSSVSLTNETTGDLGVTVKTMDFTPLSNGSIVLGQTGPAGAQSGLAQWMSLPGGSSLTLKAGQKTDIQVLIDNRSDLAPGGHYGALVISTMPLGTNGSNQVAFNQQLTALFFVKKVGGDIANMSLTSLRADSGPGVPTTAALVFKSTGNVYVVPRGYVEVTDARNKLIAKGLINPESTLIPQGTSRSFDTILQPVANIRPSGRLKLTAYYRFDGQNSFSQRSMYLSRATLSRPQIVFVLVALAVLAAVLYLLFGHRRRGFFHSRSHPN